MAQLDARDLDHLAIFPLPNVVLFPGTTLPLYVFESRYIEMIEDVLGGTRLLGIARLAPGFELHYEGRPQVYEVATVGEIVQAQQLPDHRYSVLVHGRDRIHIDRELPPVHAYREVEASILDGRQVKRADAALALREQLVLLCGRLSEHVERGGEELMDLVLATSDSAELADVLAATLVNDTDDQQSLLETLDPVGRLDILVDHVSELLARIGAHNARPN